MLFRSSAACLSVRCLLEWKLNGAVRYLWAEEQEEELAKLTEQLVRLAADSEALKTENEAMKTENDTLKMDLETSLKHCADVIDQNG